MLIAIASRDQKISAYRMKIKLLQRMTKDPGQNTSLVSEEERKFIERSSLILKQVLSKSDALIVKVYDNSLHNAHQKRNKKKFSNGEHIMDYR